MDNLILIFSTKMGINFDKTMPQKFFTPPFYRLFATLKIYFINGIITL